MINKGFWCLLFISLLLVFQSCNEKRQARVIINGDIKNLPDGIMVLYGTNNGGLADPIDSTSCKNGRFSFKCTKNVPFFLTLKLHGKDGVKYFFQFLTNKKYKGGGLFSEYFMGDDTILINGTLKEFIPKSFVLNKDTKFVYPDKPVIAGRQTYVLYNIDLSFNPPKSDSLINLLGDSIRKYNYSYYLLTELNKNRNNFSKTQLVYLISLFDSSVQRSDIAIELKESIQHRSDKAISMTTFLDENNKGRKIGLTQSKITMLVLWASWCGPCRIEIPILKQLFRKYSKDTRFKLISVSLDSKMDDWLKALKQEDMPWLQLRLPPSTQSFSTEIFHFDGSIPTTLFINDSGRIFKSTHGYEAGLLKTYEKIIDATLN